METSVENYNKQKNVADVEGLDLPKINKDKVGAYKAAGFWIRVAAHFIDSMVVALSLIHI